MNFLPYFQYYGQQQFYSLKMENSSQIYPRRLPKDFHGTPKPREKRSTILPDTPSGYVSYNSSKLQNPEDRYRSKITYMQQPTRRLNRDVISERSELISHPAKISKDTPEWWKSTYKYFTRAERPKQNNSTIHPKKPYEGEKDYDVFNRKRDSYMTIQNPRMQGLYTNRSKLVNKSSITEKVGSEERGPLKKMPSVTRKVGSVEHRDYTIRRPALKIGSHSFVDTYSVF